MTEEITKDIFSRNKTPNMTIGNTEDGWHSVPGSPTGNGYIMLGDSKYVCYDREIHSLPIDHTEDTFIKELEDIRQKIHVIMYSAIPDDEDMPVQHPIQPDISETYARVEDVISLVQRFNEPEAALLVAAAQDFLDWMKNV